MKLSAMKGLSFGLTSGIITTLGLIVGLDSTTKSKVAVIGGIIIIAVADAMSDALGMHVSEEAEVSHTSREIWESTGATFLAKFFFALTFLIPVMLLSLSTAVIVSIIWGFSLITIFSIYLAKKQNVKAHTVVFEHLLIAVIVVVATHYLGHLVARFFSA